MEQDEKMQNEETESSIEPVNKYMKIKRFQFIMIMFLLVFLTAGITTFALSFGEEKVVERPVIQERKEFSKLYEAYEQIQSFYVEDVNHQKLVDGAINGMVEAIGDPYSDYMTVEETQSFYENISSSFEGIGAQIEERDGNITIVSPIKGSPAEKVGLRPNDAIIEVNGENIQGMSSTEAVLLIRGEKGTEVELTILRPGLDDPMKVKIVRDIIPLETVYSEMLEGNIGKVQITQFAERTYTELQTHIADLKEKGMKGLILDVRQNPGGLLEQAEFISSMFVPKGEIIYQMEYKDGSRKKEVSSQEGPFDLPMVVVIDGGSASASEILAAAVQESAGIKLVGEKTFGKGTAQTAGNFSDGSNLKITTAKWLTPTGKSIHENGIMPDYQVSWPEYANLPFVDTKLELKTNILSDEVKTIETMLNVLGYNPGTVDGLFDEETTTAVKAFQKDQGIEETGIVTGETTNRIMVNLQNKLIEEDPQIQKAVEVLTGQLQ